MFFRTCFSALLIVMLTLVVMPLIKVDDIHAADELPVYTFVIVHGATGGGWDWKIVAEHLSAQGHMVYRPTLTGLGEKTHLANAQVNLTTHITDVTNLILFEDLNNVVLVGHSYGGMVISGVANRLPERIKHLTFLDASVPDDGMAALDVWGTKLSELVIRDNLVYFPWLEDIQTFPRDVPHPVNTLTEPVEFDHPDALHINASYVAFVPQEMTKEERMQDQSWSRAKARGWTIRTFDGDHVVYRVKPKEFVEMLLQTPRDRNRAVAN